MPGFNSLQMENRAIRHIERAYMNIPRSSTYIALEDIDFCWDERTVQKAVFLWNEGLHLHEIAKKLNRPEDDTFAILWDQSRKGKITLRIGAIYGSR